MQRPAHAVYPPVSVPSAIVVDISRLAGAPLTFGFVLLVHGPGEMGREMAARAVHRQSSRASQPFVLMRCADVSEPLRESTLFGDEQGVFDAAGSRRIGCFEQASGGTLFLDDVDRLGLALQARLLDTIQQQANNQEAGRSPIGGDVWLMASSRCSPSALTQLGLLHPNFDDALAVVTREESILTLRALEESYIASMMKHTHGHIGRAAQLLGVHRNTLARKLRQYGL